MTIVSFSLDDLIPASTQAIAFAQAYLTIQKEVANELTFNPKVIQQIERNTGLIFAKTPHEGEVCFAQSATVRPEFSVHFTTQEIKDYVRAMWKKHHPNTLSIKKLRSASVPYPDSVAALFLF